MHRQYKLNQQAAQTDPLMTALSLSAYRVMSSLSPLAVVVTPDWKALFGIRILSMVDINTLGEPPSMSLENNHVEAWVVNS